MSAGQTASSYATAEVVRPDRLAVAGRISDYLELAKPRIASMVLLTVTVGFALGSKNGEWQVAQLIWALIGIGLVAAASGAGNQLIERRTDGRS